MQLLYHLDTYFFDIPDMAADILDLSVKLASTIMVDVGFFCCGSMWEMIRICLSGGIFEIIFQNNADTRHMVFCEVTYSDLDVPL